MLSGMSVKDRGRRQRWRGAVFLLLLFFALSARAEEAYQVKAAFIYNFTKFVTWPTVMEQRGGELRLCLYGGNPFGDYIFQLDGRKVRNFYLHVQEIRSVNEVDGCNILYLSHGSRKALDAVADHPVLTVSDSNDFAEHGGSIELLSENNRIRFDVNLQRIKDCGLEISSKLLQLARQVY